MRGSSSRKATDRVVLVFTRSAAQEARHKPLARTRAASVAAMRALIAHTIATVRRLPDVDVVLSESQRGATAGEALAHAVDELFRRGYRQVVVVGNDTPRLTAERVDRAFRELSRSGRRRAVIGPTTDGGYFLLGLNRPCPTVFRDVPWGTARVTSWTREHLRRRGIDSVVLDTLPEIDSGRDLSEFLRTAPASRRLLRLRAKLHGALASGVTRTESRTPFPSRPDPCARSIDRRGPPRAA